MTVEERATLREEVVGYLRPLLNYARAEISAAEALGLLPRRAVSPEDVVDEAVARALQDPDRAPDERLYPWLRRLVRRVLEREIRDWGQRMRERSLEEPVGIEGDDSSGPPRRLIDLIPDPSAPIPDQVIEGREFQRYLLDLLRQLPESWREPFVLHLRDELPVERIAAIEGLPVDEVRRRIERARDFIRARIEEEYRDSPIPPPTEELLLALEWLEPSPEQIARTRRAFAKAS